MTNLKGLLFAVLLAAACGGETPVAEHEDAVQSQQLAGWGWSWQYVGTVQFVGGVQNVSGSFYPIAATHVLLESPVYCAPRVTAAWAHGYGDGLRPLYFQGQRIWGANYQALYQVGYGWPYPNAIDGLSLQFAAIPLRYCPINVYTVWQY